MKGIVFTLDALFALMITAAGISVLLYFTYVTPTTSYTQYTLSSSLLKEMSLAKLSSISGIPLALEMVNQSAASGQSWHQVQKDAQYSGGNPTGPSLGTVAYTVNAPNPITNGTILAGYGDVYFASGNIMYAINASTGITRWTSGSPYNSVWSPASGYYSPPIVGALLYRGMVIYATDANIMALNALNGSVVWASAVPYTIAIGGEQEPDGDEYPPMMFESNGKIITGTSDACGDASGITLYAFSPGNGTIIGNGTGILSSAGLLARYSAAYGSQIVSTVFSCNTYQFTGLQMLTDIYNNTYAAANVWGSSGSGAASFESDVAIYSNTFAVGQGNHANLLSSSGSLISSVADANSALESGVSSYGGVFAFQGTSAVLALNSTGSQLWYARSQSHTALLNQTPIQSLQNLYEIWGDGYVTEQNRSTGTFTGSVAIPYSLTNTNINPHMALAYGKLFASVGSHLIAFGTCAASSNSSILTDIGTMYINNEGSCADYLLNSLSHTENSTFTVNNQSILTVSDFNGANSVVTIPYSQNLSLSNNFTVSIWFYSALPPTSTFSSELIDTIQKVNVRTMDLSLIGNNDGASTGIHGDIGNGASWLSQSVNYPFTFSQDTWYNLVAVYTPSSWTLYINGNAISGTYSGSPSLLDGTSNIQLGSGSGSNQFNGALSDMQIYNTSLTTAQVAQLYRGGINGGPVSTRIAAWFPLAGDANGYSSQQYFPGFTSGVTYSDATNAQPGLSSSYSISSQTVPVVLFNYSTGDYKLYNVGVYTWR